MTKLTTYTVSFRTEQDSAFDEIAAASPEAALAKARAIAEDPRPLARSHFDPIRDIRPSMRSSWRPPTAKW